MQRRMEIAGALHDQADLDRTLASYQRVVALTGEDSKWDPILKGRMTQISEIHPENEKPAERP
jgi:hypothetical protein